MLFKDIIGQQAVKRSLVKMVERGRIPHAQLLVGDEGRGALPLAFAFARYINCEARAGDDACGCCRSCVQMNQLIHPDVHFIFPVNKSKAATRAGSVEGDKPVSDHFLPLWREQVLTSVPEGYFSEQMWYQAIEIDNKQGNISRHEAAEIIRKLSFKAFESSYKILIMWLPERMNDQSANALLKILEEPWEKTLFLLVSEAPERLLKTILSRTQEIHVPGIESGEIARWLETVKGADPATAALYGKLAFGNLLEAIRLTGEAGEREEEFFSLFVQLMRLSYEDRHLELIEWGEAVAVLGRENQKALLENAVRLLRDSYMLSMGVDEVAYLHGQEYAFCKKFAPYVNNRNIEALVAECERAVREIAQNGNPRIIFPHFALSVSKLILRA
ncbi:MAG: DNA polymerase III subunit delta [Rikenellaceae bacterium]|jgi:DNA polymerase-3 subunit delta'|nr:DNA polymerase III subunit delta [Rikenellaceae bacterium]